MTQQGNSVPDASADELTRAAATEDYGGVPISDEELADVWQAPAATGDIVDPDDDLDDADDSDFADYDPLADGESDPATPSEPVS